MSCGGYAAELVSNATFDTNTTGWTPVNTATIASVAGGQSGNCLQITEDNTAANPGAYQDVVTVIGKIYEFSAYIKKGTEATYVIKVSETDGSEATQITAEATTSWVRQYSYYIATATTTRFLLQQTAVKGAGTTILFDTVSIKECLGGKGLSSFGSEMSFT